MKTFVIAAEGDAWDCFVAVLGELTVGQLNSRAFEENVRQAKIAAVRREAAAKEALRLNRAGLVDVGAAEATRAEWAAFDEPLPIETTGVYVPPEAGDQLAETDEPTAIEVTDPKS